MQIAKKHRLFFAMLSSYQPKIAYHLIQSNEERGWFVPLRDDDVIEPDIEINSLGMSTDKKESIVRPMKIDNLFTILARLTKLTRDDDLMCTIEDFFDSNGEIVLHKQFGNHYYATTMHIICQYHNINLLERCVN